MSEPKLISPLLDGFLMGPSMSAHPGIQSCPAMPKDSNQRYIVKIISIPASAVQLEAMLLTGAYASQEAALSYFQEEAQRIINEIGVLKKLASLEGFLPFEGHQLVEKEDEPGYALYMLSPYKLSLERHLNRHTMTHLNAVNLGLDMCASLAVCRRAGYLYVNLKPENIFMSEDKEFRIGDLGFVKLDSLKYTSLDERYYSAYSAPECKDIFATINTTIDTYAAGMILYQTYNDGVLPAIVPGEILPPPQYADYEMAEIILKAIDPDPAKRWKDPIAMGQAIVAYMQKNGANDVPIVPAGIAVADAAPVQPVAEESAAVEAPAVEALVEEAPVEETIAQEIADTVADAAVLEEETPEMDEFPQVEPLLQDIPVEEIPMDIVPAESAPSQATADEAASQPDAEEIAADPEEDVDDILLYVQSFLDEEMPEAEAVTQDGAVTDTIEGQEIPAGEALPQEVPAQPEEPEETEEPSAAEAPIAADDPANLAFMQMLVNDETAPSEEMAAEFGYDEVSQEASSILALADELLLHETPAGVVAPEPIDVPVPPPIVPVTETPSDDIDTIDANYQPPSAFAEDAAEQDADTDGYDGYDEDYDEDFEDIPSKFSWKKLIIAVVLVLLIGAVCVGAYYYYQNYYILKIQDLDVVGNADTISVQVTSNIDDDLITIECIDNNGTKRTAAVVDGYAEFSDLNPDTLYRIYVKVEGKHKVLGEQEARYTTPKITNVISFTAIAGTEDGSATLRFKVDGQTAKSWSVVYSTEGEEEKVKEFTDDMVTVTGLTVGKTYTFRLKSDDQVYIVGNSTLEYTAQALVMAQDVQITSCDNGVLSVIWQTPEGQNVNSWTVRCYNEDTGYSDTVTTQGNTADFAVPDTTKGYTVAVTAEGMTTPSRAFLKPNSITIQNFKINDTDPTKLIVSWQHNGPAPEGEWLLMYRIDGAEQQTVIRSTRIDSVVVPNKVPNSTYEFTISTQAGVTVFNGFHTVTTAAAPEFDNYAEYNVSAKDIVFTMCKTPDKANWTYTDIEIRTNAFKLGEKASFGLHLMRANSTSLDPITVMFVIRDAQGNAISYHTTSSIWTNMWSWNNGAYRGKLDVPALPDQAGSYTMEIYFNGCSVHTQQFTVSE